MAAASILRELVEKYERFVVQHASVLGRCESAARILAYFTPGGSELVSELVSSLVGITVFINDVVLRRAAHIKLNMRIPVYYLTTCLTILDNLEVFLEMASFSSGGERTKWSIIACIHFFKAVVHFILLYRYKSGILSSPPIPSLKRDKSLLDRLKQNRTTDVDSLKKNNAYEDGTSKVLHKSDSHSLKSSGENHDNSTEEDEVSKQDGGEPTILSKRQLFAESLHIARPLVHLLGMYIYGQNSWKPYLIAGGMDVSSLLAMGNTIAMTDDEKEEIRRRVVLLVLYLMRSPFYDRYSRKRLMMLLGFIVYKIPALRVVIRPLVEYLPVFQSIYCYVWMN